jgi:inner membrane protein
MNRSLLLKTVLVAALAILLMLPVQMIRDLVAERQARHNEALGGIAEGWGKRQTIAGPYLAMPYERRWTEVKRESVDGRSRESRIERTEWQVLRVPAASLDWRIDADIGEKARGIYKARLYSARVSAAGSVSVPSRLSVEDGASRYRWGTPRLVLGVSDPLGIRAAPQATVAGKKIAFAPASGDSGITGGLHVLRSRSSSAARKPCPSRRSAPTPASRCAPTGRIPRSRGASCPRNRRCAPTASARAGRSRASPRRAARRRTAPSPAAA